VLLSETDCWRKSVIGTNEERDPIMACVNTQIIEEDVLTHHWKYIPTDIATLIYRKMPTSRYLNFLMRAGEHKTKV
jgi:hypothetical protein